MNLIPAPHPQSLPVVSRGPLNLQSGWNLGGHHGDKKRWMSARSSINLKEWLGGDKPVEGELEGICPTKSQLQNHLQNTLETVLTVPTISRSDDAFAADGVEFVEGIEGINIEELNDLFVKVGFCHRDSEKLLLALKNTHCVIWIRCAKKTRWARYGQVLGFARAMSDGVLSATIWDVAVLPAWQRAGLGRGLVERLVKRLREQEICNISLYAEPHVVRLYENLGFVKGPEGIRGMAFQRKSVLGKKVASKQND